MRRSVNARWAGKIMRAKNFVILTDKESVICMSGLKPAKLDDHIMLAAQAAELEAFDLKLQSLIKQHQRVINKMLGGDNKKASKKAKVTKIKVR